MASEYVIQVIHKATNKVVHSWAPGLAVEKELISELLDRVKAKGVGIARTEYHVLADVKEAIEELLHDLKSRV